MDSIIFQMKKEDIIDYIFRIGFWVFFAIAVVTAIWYIFGDSPTFEQSILIVILPFVVNNTARTFKLETDIKWIKKSLARIEEKIAS